VRLVFAIAATAQVEDFLHIKGKTTGKKARLLKLNNCLKGIHFPQSDAKRPKLTIKKV